MPASINVAGYNGTINDLTVNGNLTLTGSFTSSGFMGHSATFVTPVGQVALSETLIVGIAVQTNGIGADIAASNVNSRFTYTGATTRSWLITYSIGCPDLSSNIANVFQVWVKKNSTTRYGQNLICTHGSIQHIFSCSTIITMAPNDYIELYAYQSIGVAYTISSGGFETTLTIME